MTDFITAEETAAILRCDYDYALGLFRTRQIRARKVGRRWLTTRDAVETFVLEEQTTSKPNIRVRAASHRREEDAVKCIVPERRR